MTIMTMLSPFQIALLAAYAAGMSAGQVLFKLAAIDFAAAGGGLLQRLVGLALNPYFVGAVIFYAGLAVLWVWVLSFTPLSRAYPFVALAFAVTPFIGAALFGEPISARLLLGLVFVLCGLYLVTG
jgi:drug/metabolite transporter (DMT)-like permease